VAAGLKKRSCLLTAASSNEDLSYLRGVELHVVPSEKTLTFEHTYTWFGNQRQLRVTRKPDVKLSAEHVPWHCRVARIVLLGPLVQQDVDVASFTKPESWVWKAISNLQHIGLMGQGQQRELGPKGSVKHLRSPSKELKDSLTPEVHLFLSDVETDIWPAAEREEVVSQVKSLVVTRGGKGVSIHRDQHETLHIPAVPIQPVDTNGAGDTFATTFMIEVFEGLGVEQAGKSATWAASRVCLQPQACKPSCCSEAVQEKDHREQQPQPSTTKPSYFRLETLDFGGSAAGGEYLEA
jgi:hypothetical protein